MAKRVERVSRRKRVPLIGSTDVNGEIKKYPNRHSVSRPGPGPADLRAVSLYEHGGCLDEALAYFVPPPDGQIDLDAIGKLAYVRCGGKAYVGRLFDTELRKFSVVTVFGDYVLKGVEIDAAAPVLWIRP